jgi:hypothetical protein
MVTKIPTLPYMKSGINCPFSKIVPFPNHSMIFNKIFAFFKIVPHGGFTAKFSHRISLNETE